MEKVGEGSIEIGTLAKMSHIIHLFDLYDTIARISGLSVPAKNAVENWRKNEKKGAAFPFAGSRHNSLERDVPHA